MFVQLVVVSTHTLSESYEDFGIPLKVLMSEKDTCEWAAPLQCSVDSPSFFFFHSDQSVSRPLQP